MSSLQLCAMVLIICWFGLTIYFGIFKDKLFKCYCCISMAFIFIFILHILDKLGV